MSKLYRVDGYDQPLRLSPEHAEQIGAQLVQPIERPDAGALKAEWVAYAESHGVPLDQAEAMTIAELKAVG